MYFCVNFQNTASNIELDNFKAPEPRVEYSSRAVCYSVTVYTTGNTSITPGGRWEVTGCIFFTTFVLRRRESCTVPHLALLKPVLPLSRVTATTAWQQEGALPHGRGRSITPGIPWVKKCRVLPLARSYCACDVLLYVKTPTYQVQSTYIPMPPCEEHSSRLPVRRPLSPQQACAVSFITLPR